MSVLVPCRALGSLFVSAHGNVQGVIDGRTQVHLFGVALSLAGCPHPDLLLQHRYAVREASQLLHSPGQLVRPQAGECKSHVELRGRKSFSASGDEAGCEEARGDSKTMGNAVAGSALERVRSSEAIEASEAMLHGQHSAWGVRRGCYTFRGYFQ